MAIILVIHLILKKKTSQTGNDCTKDAIGAIKVSGQFLKNP